MTQHRRIQSLPTRVVTGYWDEGSTSDVPENIRILFSSGQRCAYRIYIENENDIEKPHPSCLKAIGNIRTGYMYGYQGKHAKK